MLQAKLLFLPPCENTEQNLRASPSSKVTQEAIRQWITSSFYWPGINNDVIMLNLSYNVCQRTIPKGIMSKELLCDILLIDVISKCSAIGIFDISIRTSNYKHMLLSITPWIILKLKNIEIECIAEVQLWIFIHAGFLKEISKWRENPVFLEPHERTSLNGSSSFKNS